MKVFRVLLTLLALLAAPLVLAQAEVDYDDWTVMAERAEVALNEGGVTDVILSEMRSRFVEERAKFVELQGTNATRIATLKEQIAALGPAPEEGVEEAPEISTLRRELAQQLATAEAPRLRAVEATRRADGIIAEIDAILNERDRQAFVNRIQSPLSPSLIAKSVAMFGQSLRETGRGVVTSITAAQGLAGAQNRLPMIILLVVTGLVLILRSRRLIGRLLGRIAAIDGADRAGLLGLIVSLGQVILPVAGLYALAEALRLTGFYGPHGKLLIDLLPDLGITFFTARWLASRVMPAHAKMPRLLPLPDESLIWGRFWAAILAFVLIGSIAVIDFAKLDDYPPEVVSALEFPLVVLAGVGLFSLGRILSRPLLTESETSDEPLKRGLEPTRIVRILGRALMVFGVVGPLLGALGYYDATEYAIYSTIQTLAIIAFVLVVQQAVRDIAVLVTKDRTAGEGLWPTLANFAVAIAALPFLALNWGASPEDLSDLWRNFNEGLSLGETRISPTSFLTLIFVFVLGFLATRVVQAAVRNSILPRTKIETGGQVAIVSGLGYVGIFIAALVAIASAGLDLSSLAIVAGALSVGIGFGLQNIVSNFVSGIILLIERPIGQGDWIEVGGQMGYVRNISVRSTRIETFDRTDVIVPNADLVSGTVTNYTRGNSVGRAIVPVGVAYGTDTRKVEAILREIAEAHPMVLLNPKPAVVFMGFGADSMDFEIRAILRDVNYVLSVRSDMNHEIAVKFAENEIEIPFAQRDVWLRNPEALHAPAPKGSGAQDTEEGE